ncbi:KI18A-like protein [Mya arenaria]|uniref:KI18A-like protein n=1 Tax=Mya arenaria TaxID=6604 RepID=A0ABY7E0M3_MYAAR|nr:KI18A-like protein [Mya arenaria]
MPLSSSRKRPHEPDVESEESSKSNVKVVVRIRPQNVKEVEGNYREVVQAVDENILIFDPKENSSNEYGGTSRKHRDIRKRANRDLKFAFDHVFGPSANNIDIFNETTQGVLNGLLDGYNCSVFAYGATGAGKTHTMLGSQDNPGVMYHTMMNLYNRIDQMKDTKTCDVAVSYLEVYNETIRDLLMPGSVLPVREDPGKGVIIPGLSLHKPKTAEELLYMLQFGNQHRTQHPTDANAESSRSHAVLQVFVRQKDRTANISTEVRVAKLCLVDLAGSERATVTKNKGSRFREGANINRSLLALGNVINALAENKSKGFVPYRDSKLTRLLKDSLGGNCQTVMIAAVSPSSMSYEDTYNTLRYADRAKHIKATLKKNVLNVDFHMAQYGKIVQELRKEIKELKGKLQAYEDGKMISSRQPAASVVQVANWARYQGELLRLYVGHQTRVSEQLQGEVTLRNLQWKMYRKARSLSRIKVLDDPGSAENAKTVDGFLNELRQKTSCMEISSESSRNKVKESCKHLTDTLQKMKSHAAGENNKKTPEVLQLQVQVHHLQSELESSNVQMEYSRQVVRCQERELAHNERLLHLSLKLLRQQHYIIKGHGMLTSDLAGSYSEVLARVGGQEVTWGDSEIGVTYTRGYTLADMLRLPTTALKFEDPNTDVSEVECPAVAGSKRVFQFTAPLHDSRQVEPALNYSNCVEESQTGLPVSLGENESGTSTIVDQSANSVASLASVSTLIDGPQNLSQNLSGTEETSQCGERQGRDNVIELNSTILCGDARPETVSKSLKHKTVTKSKSTETGVKSYTVTKSSQVGSEKPVVSKAMRSIQFDDSEKSPHQGKSYAEIVRTPTPDRPPLRQVGNSNTPLSTSRTDSRSSCESPFGKRRSGDKLTPSQLFDKENCDSLSRYGIPSLVASSLLTSGKTNEQHSGGAPSYMQATKSHINKKKLNSSKNTSLNSSDEISTGPPRTTSNLAKSTFITKHARPLSTHMRSKSTTNVSSRAAWQI